MVFIPSNYDYETLIPSNYDYETIKARVRHFDRLIPTFKWGKRMCWEFIYVRFPDGTHWRLY